MTNVLSDVRFTNPGPDAGNLASLQEQAQWLDFAEQAEKAKLEAGEPHDLATVGSLALQNAEDQVDAKLGIAPPTPPIEK